MVNYGNGKIYKIVRLSDNMLVYVGSTTKEYLSSRLVEHKRKAKRCPNRKVYRTVLDNDGWLNHQILLIKLYPCNSRDELHSEEARFIRALKPVSNIQIPMRTKQEYNQEYSIENKAKIQQYKKEYNVENKTKIQQYKKEYRIDNKEKLQQYYIDNSEQIIAKNILYYNENKETIKENRNKKINCCCGKIIIISNKSRHIKTIKHINSIPVQFKILEEMHNNRKHYIFPALPELKI